MNIHKNWSLHPLVKIPYDATGNSALGTIYGMYERGIFLYQGQGYSVEKECSFYTLFYRRKAYLVKYENVRHDLYMQFF